MKTLNGIVLFGSAMTSLALLGGVAQAGNVTTGLIAHYTFDDCSLNDSVGGFNGVKTGTGTLACVTGAQSKALSFDGKTYIKLPKLGAQWSDGFSICAWIRPTEESTTFDRRLFEMANGSTAYNVRLSNRVSAYNGHTNTIYPTAVSRGVTNYTLQPGTQWQLKGTPWEHWCLTIDNLNPQMKMYRDGGLIGNTVGKIENVDRDSVVIGASWDGTGIYKGLIDEFRIYARALDGAEVAELRAFESPLLGSVRDGALPDKTVTCKNVTTTVKKTFKIKGNDWNCTGAGLKVNPGDKVTITTTVTGD